MSKSDDTFSKLKRGEITFDEFIAKVDRTVMGIIRGLEKQEAELRRDNGRLSEELRKVRQDQVEIRGEIDRLQKTPWPSKPNRDGDDTLKKGQALLPTPTHSAPPRLM